MVKIEEYWLKKTGIKLIGQEISLEEYTLERCHEFWRDYVADYAMWERDYIYNKEDVDKYYSTKVKDKSRVYFAIVHKGKVLGEIQLKYINLKEKYGTISVHLSRNEYKNQGFGTEAERLLIQYAFQVLKLKTIYADTVHRNTRSQHVLKKLGFVYTHQDEVLRYYKLEL